MKTLLENFIDKDSMKNFVWPCVIAGGCLRDCLFNKPVKDVDVFIALPYGLMKQIYAQGYFNVIVGTGMLCDRLLGISLGVEHNSFIIEKGDEYEIGGFISAKSAGHPGLNIIIKELNSGWDARYWQNEFVEELFEEFPCSISKVAWDVGKDTWYFAEDFKESVRNREVVFYDATPKYIDKIRPKYDDLFSYQYNYKVTF